MPVEPRRRRTRPSTVAPSFWRELARLPEDLSLNVLQLCDRRRLTRLVDFLQFEMAQHRDDFVAAWGLDERVAAELNWRKTAQIYRLVTAWDVWVPKMMQRLYAAADRPVPASVDLFPPALWSALSCETLALVDNSGSIRISEQKEMLEGLQSLALICRNAGGFSGPLYVAPLNAPPHTRHSIPASHRGGAYKVAHSADLLPLFAQWFPHNQGIGISPLGSAVVQQIGSYQALSEPCPGGAHKRLNLLLLTDGDADDLGTFGQSHIQKKLFNFQNRADWPADQVSVQCHLLGPSRTQLPDVAAPWAAASASRLQAEQMRFRQFAERVTANRDLPGISFQVFTEAQNEDPLPLSVRLMRGLMDRPGTAGPPNPQHWPFAKVASFGTPGLVHRAGVGQALEGPA